MNLKRILAAALSAATLLSLTACSGGAASSNTPSKTDPASAPSTASQAEAGKVVYPIPGNKKLSIYGGFDYCTNAYSSRKESPVHQWLAEATGVEIEWVEEPTGADSSTFFNTLMASPESLPDILFIWNARNNAEQYMRDGQMLDITDKIEVNAPDYVAYLNANPKVKKAATTDSGKLTYFPFMRGSDYLRTWGGLMCRGDLLKECGLEVPTTVAEFENVLKVFKEKYNSVLKLQSDDIHGAWGSISGAYDAVGSWYLDSNGDKKIHFGGVEDGYREYLKLLRSWYQAGYLNEEWTSYDANALKSTVISGETAVFSGGAGRISAVMQEAEATGKTNVTVVAIPMLTLEKGGKNYFGQSESALQTSAAFLSPNCKDVETAIQFLNYGYTEAGQLLFNFGKEGVSFEMKDGTPVYTDLVKNDEMGLTTAITKYGMMKGSGAPSIQLESFWRAYNNQEAADAVEVWLNSKTDNGGSVVPEITPTSEEADQTSTVETAINTYLTENAVKFVVGELDINDDAAWNKFKSDLNNYGLETVLKVKNDQLDRYNKRGN